MTNNENAWITTLNGDTLEVAPLTNLGFWDSGGNFLYENTWMHVHLHSIAKANGEVYEVDGGALISVKNIVAIWPVVAHEEGA